MFFPVYKLEKLQIIFGFCFVLFWVFWYLYCAPGGPFVETAVSSAVMSHQLPCCPQQLELTCSLWSLPSHPAPPPQVQFHSFHLQDALKVLIFNKLKQQKNKPQTIKQTKPQTKKPTCVAFKKKKNRTEGINFNDKTYIISYIYIRTYIYIVYNYIY